MNSRWILSVFLSALLITGSPAASVYAGDVNVDDISHRISAGSDVCAETEMAVDTPKLQGYAASADYGPKDAASGDDARGGDATLAGAPGDPVTEDAASKHPAPQEADIGSGSHAFEMQNYSDELFSLKAGEDYIEDEGFVIADTEGEAMEKASACGGVLTWYHKPVGIIEFPGREMSSVLSSISRKKLGFTVYPNCFSHFTDLGEVRILEDIPADNGEAGDPGSYAAGDTDSCSDDTANAAGDTDSYAGDPAYAAGSRSSDIVNSVPKGIPLSAEYNDPYYNDDDQWYLKRAGVYIPHSMGINGSGVTVALLDSGVQASHLDLKANIKKCVNYDGHSGDPEGHGTHCAGIIAMVGNNKKGGVGVAPGAKIYSIRVGYIEKKVNFGIPDAFVVAGVYEAADQGCNVISMSFGGAPYNESLQNAINYATERGCVCVAAAGNESTNEPLYPSAYDNVISVAAGSYENNTLAEYSNYGDWVDVVAPGGDYTEYFYPGENGSLGIMSTYPKNAYVVMSGTSMACPVVSGTAALAYSSNKDFLQRHNGSVARKISDLIIGTKDKTEYRNGNMSVTGMVRANAAVSEASGAPAEGERLHMTDQWGFHDESLTNRIAPGKKVKLFIGSPNGVIKNTPEMKYADATKAATWVSSDESVLTVNKGVVTCSKDAAPGTYCRITAYLGSDVLYCDFTVNPVIKYFGIQNVKTKKTSKGVTFSYFVNTSCKITATAGLDYSLSGLSNPYSLAYAGLFFDGNKTDGFRGYAADSDYKYRITVSNRKNVLSDEEQQNGDPSSISLKKKGSYSIKYTLCDGSNKSFTIKVTAK